MGVDLHGYDTNDLQVKYSHNILTCNHKAAIDFPYGSIPVCSVDKLRVSETVEAPLRCAIFP